MQRSAIATIYYALNKAPPRYLRCITHSLWYTRLSPLFEEMSLAADSDARKLYRRLLYTRIFYFLHMGKPVASRFGQMVNRIQDWWILIPFGNRVCICLSQFRLRKNGCESRKLIFKKGLKTWNPNFRLDFPTRKIAECLFRRSVCFRNFPLKRRKQPETELMASLPKHQSVLLVCFNGSCHAVASRFIHDVIQVNRLLFGIRVAFFSVLRARKGTKFEEYYNNWTNAWSKIFNCFKEISFFKPKGIVWDDLIRKYPAMQKFIQ